MSKMKTRRVQAPKFRELVPNSRTIPVNRLKFLEVGDTFVDDGMTYRITSVSQTPVLSSWKAVSETGITISLVAYRGETSALVSIQF